MVSPKSRGNLNPCKEEQVPGRAGAMHLEVVPGGCFPVSLLTTRIVTYATACPYVVTDGTGAVRQINAPRGTFALQRNLTQRASFYHVMTVTL